MQYLEWNDAVGRRFFNPDRSGTRVFLFVTTEVLSDIGASQGMGVDDFTKAVRVGPPWVTRHRQGICQQALQSLDGWRGRGLEYPPYIAYLALFVAAGTVDVGFARHSYYPGLRSLLGEVPDTGMYPSFDQMSKLWDDLAVWSNQDRKGELGIFDADIAGGWIHVGVPRSQTLMTDEERRSLPLLFEENGFDPHSPPSDAELAFLLAESPYRYLRSHTKELLRSTDSHDRAIRDALVEVILDELQNWDGSVERRDESGKAERSSLGNLRLAMILDTTARAARVGLRCRSNREYPEEGLQLDGSAGIPPLHCVSDWQGWSTLLCTDESYSRPFDASQIDWRSGIVLTDVEHSWRAGLTRRPVRVMVPGAPYGFDGFIEESQLPRGKPFHVIAHSSIVGRVEQWGVNSCEGFRKIDVAAGLPPRWYLFSAERANSDAGISEACPYLAFPKTLRIQLRGGIRLRGNQYFPFALPKVEIEGTTEDTRVFCNDQPLAADETTGAFEIPSALSVRRLIVQARQGAGHVRSRSIYTTDTAPWRSIQATARLDRFGCFVSESAVESCAGPAVDEFIPPPFRPEVFVPPTERCKVFLVGKNPGEITVYPAERMPQQWEPIWAIPMEREGYAMYCGTNPEYSSPGHNRVTDRRRVKLWQEVLWYKRKLIVSPSRPALRKLWKEYQEAAHHVT